MNSHLPRFHDTPDMMGSWPFVYTQKGSANPYLLTGNTTHKATIRSIKKEPTGGYSLSGKSFTLKVDYTMGATPPFGVTYTHTFVISFTTETTLAQVVARINALVTPTYIDPIAYDDGGFLKLQSKVSGHGSYLQIATIATSEGVFDELGLFSGTESWGGEAASSPLVDPTRQVPFPHQSSMMIGETFSEDAFNRLAIQMSVNAERPIGLLERKRLAVKAEAEITYSGVNNYFVLPGMVYTGGSPYDMDDLITIVDDNGNDIVRKKRVGLTTDATTNVTTDSDSHEMKITGDTLVFATTDPSEEIYVVLTGGTVPAAIDGVPLKVLRYIDASNAIVQNLNPLTGARVTYTATGQSGARIRIDTLKVKAEGFYKEVGLITNVNSYKESWYNGAVDRIEKGNRVYCSLADFTDVQAGDLVEWSNSAATSPYTNNGTYRVQAKIDTKTLDLCGSDYGPIVLNPTEVSVSGTINVQTDGSFWASPVVKFADAEVLPLVGTFKVRYLGMSTFQDATEGDAAILGGSVRFSKSTDSQVEQALLGIVGPSVNSFNEVLTYLYSDRRRSLEGLFMRADHEHHSDETLAPGGTKGGAGRHSTIRPDVVNMFPDVLGTTVTIRAGAAEALNTTKASVLSGNSARLLITAGGRIGIGQNPGGSYDFSCIHDSETVQLYHYSETGDILSEYETVAGGINFTYTTTDGNIAFERVGNGFIRDIMTLNNSGAPRSYTWESYSNGMYLKLVASDDGVVSNLLGFTIEGNTGVGTTTPVVPLHVRARSTLNTETLRLEGADTSTHERVGISFRPRQTVEKGSISFDMSDDELTMSSAGKLRFNASALAALKATGFRVEAYSDVHTELLTLYGFNATTQDKVGMAFYPRQSLAGEVFYDVPNDELAINTIGALALKVNNDSKWILSNSGKLRSNSSNYFLGIGITPVTCFHISAGSNLESFRLDGTADGSPARIGWHRTYSPSGIGQYLMADLGWWTVGLSTDFGIRTYDYTGFEVRTSDATYGDIKLTSAKDFVSESNTLSLSANVGIATIYGNSQLKLGVGYGSNLVVEIGGDDAWNINADGALLPYSDTFTGITIGDDTHKVPEIFTLAINAGTSVQLDFKQGVSASWRIDPAGHLMPSSNKDVGASGTRVANIYGNHASFTMASTSLSAIEAVEIRGAQVTGGDGGKGLSVTGGSAVTDGFGGGRAISATGGNAGTGGTDDVDGGTGIFSSGGNPHNSGKSYGIEGVGQGAGDGSGSGIGVYGRGVSGAMGVVGESTTNYGVVAQGNTDIGGTKMPAFRIVPQADDTFSSTEVGAMCVINNVLYVFLGSSWRAIQTLP